MCYLANLDDLLENTGDMALKRRAKKIIEEINPKNKDKILEVGCGDGFYLHLLTHLGLELNLTGVDIDKDALVSARRNLRGKKVKFLQADLMKRLPFTENMFDKIIMSEVCEHLSDDIKGLKEVKRVLKRSGTLVITVPNHNYPLLWDPVNWISEHFFNTHIKSGFWAGIWNQHIRLYKPQEIADVVKKAGFVIESMRSLTYWCLPFNHNIVYATARILYSGKLDSGMVQAISKYETKIKRPFLLNIAFWGVNIIDKLNDIFPIEYRGVGVILKVKKP